MAVQNSVRSYVGIAKEVTKGTAVAATDYLLLSKDAFKPVDVIDPLYDKGLRGAMVENYNYIPGRTSSTIDYGGAVFADGIGYGLTGIMGACATVGASAPYTHTISLKNSLAASTDVQPLSYTITDFYAAGVRQYTAQQITDFSLKFNADGMLEYDMKSMGFASNTTTAPTPTFSTVLPTPVWQGTVSIGAVSITNAMEGTISMKRSSEAIYGISQTQNPYSVFVGALEVTGNLKFVMEADTELTRYLTNTQPAIVLNWAYGTAAAAVQIQATLTKGAYTAAVIERSDDYVTISVDINAQGNSTDAGASGGFSPIKWVIQNAKASGTYI
jgi:hypothetical protein